MTAFPVDRPGFGGGNPLGPWGPNAHSVFDRSPEAIHSELNRHATNFENSLRGAGIDPSIIKKAVKEGVIEALREMQKTESKPGQQGGPRLFGYSGIPFGESHVDPKTHIDPPDMRPKGNMNFPRVGGIPGGGGSGGGPSGGGGPPGGGGSGGGSGPPGGGGGGNPPSGGNNYHYHQYYNNQQQPDEYENPRLTSSGHIPRILAMGTNKALGRMADRWAPEVTTDDAGVHWKPNPVVGNDPIKITAEEKATHEKNRAGMGVVQKAVKSLGAGDAAGAVTRLAEANPWVMGAVLTYEGVKKGLQVSTEQRAANAQYQSVLGGSNASGFGQRFQAASFGFRSLGTLSGAQAQELFTGTTALGMQGTARSRANNVAVDLYKSLGMSISQSLDAITVAAMNGNRSLTNLASSIKSVSQVAAGAGVNANTARQNYIANYSSLSASGAGGGVQAPQVAAALTNATSSLGNQFSNLNVASSITGTIPQLMQASALGITQGRLNIAEAGPGGANVASTLGQMSIIKAVQMVLGPNYAPLAAIVKKALDEGTAQGIPFENQINGIIQDNAGLFPPNTNVAISQLETFGGIKGITASNLNQYLLNAIAGTMSSVAGSNLTRGNVSSNSAKVLQPVGKPGSVPVSRRGAPTSANSGNPLSLAQTTKDILGQVGNFTSGNHGTPVSGLTKSETNVLKTLDASVGSTTGNLSGAQSDYVKHALQSNSTNPILAKLLYNPQTRNAKYTVQVGGKDVIVSADDLVKHFGDQVAAGTVTIASGTDRGRNVKDSTGMAAVAGQKVTSNKVSAAEEKKMGLHVTSAEKNAADNKAYGNKVHTPGSQSGGKVTGKVVIEASQTLLNLFSFNPSGQVTLNNPPVGNTTPAQRPTG